MGLLVMPDMVADWLVELRRVPAREKLCYVLGMVRHVTFIGFVGLRKWMEGRMEEGS
jgi:hypothetical protein